MANIEPTGYIVSNSGVEYLTAILDPQHVDKVRLFDYYYYEFKGSRVLVQVVDITRDVYRIGNELAPVVFRRGIRPIEVPLARLMVIGQLGDKGLKLPEAPPPISTPIYRASPDLVKQHISLGGRLHIGVLRGLEDVEVYLNEEALARHMAIIGATGSGKTWLSVLLIEELLKVNATLVVLDPHGEYARIKDDVGKLGASATVFKLTKHHAGDVRYRVSLLSTDPEHLASVAGIGEKAVRVREAFTLAHMAVTLAARLFQDKSIASLTNMDRLLGEVSSGRSIQVQRLSTIFRLKYPVGNFNGSLLYSKLLRVLEDLSALAQTPQGRNAAIAARRYVRRLGKLGIYGPKGTPLSKILKRGHVSIINLAGLDSQVQDHVAYSVIERIFKARVNYMRNLPGAKYPDPVVIIVEEAHNLAPRGRSTLAKGMLAKVATEGRKFGVFLIIITQRPSRIDEDVLSQVQNYALLRIVNPRDREALLEVGEFMDQTLDKVLSSLNRGEALLMGPIVNSQIPIVARLRDRVLNYSGGDIDLGRYWKPSRGHVSAFLSELSSKLSRHIRIRARALVGRVRDVKVSGNSLMGLVDGARVEVDLSRGVFKCSNCGVNREPCIHAAALLLKTEAVEVKGAKTR